MGPTWKTATPIRNARGRLISGSRRLISKPSKTKTMKTWNWSRWPVSIRDWFTEDERRHSHKDLPVTKELVQEYRDRMKEINVRPIKKVVEAKARKKRRATGRMERAKKKADMISETMGIS